MNRLKTSIKKDDFESFKRNSDEVGLDYDAGVYSYGQCHADDVLENYVQWYSYFDDATLAVESYHQAYEKSIVYCNTGLSEQELKEVSEMDIGEVRQDLRSARKPINSGSDVKW
ncbi:hypothetical protein [Vibrio sp. 1978]|uniref:hypothetical protein n=1 Tax=Vibrio sp. 1978 TaxID=3074585 RepID=UPI002967672F|nr:hypothetical protein [Vibrio sp. 1978]MDW3055785.1 hypothetical protein [Vibrio sp. 1978]